MKFREPDTFSRSSHSTSEPRSGSDRVQRAEGSRNGGSATRSTSDGQDSCNDAAYKFGENDS
jgi:hypothetical protein